MGELNRAGSCGGALPEVLAAGQRVTIELRSCAAILGNLCVEGMKPIPFGVQVQPQRPPCAGLGSGSSGGGELVNFVASELRQRSVLTEAGVLEFGSGAKAKGEGTAVELAISSGRQAEMQVLV